MQPACSLCLAKSLSVGPQRQPESRDSARKSSASFRWARQPCGETSRRRFGAARRLLTEKPRPLPRKMTLPAGRPALRTVRNRWLDGSRSCFCAALTSPELDSACFSPDKVSGNLEGLVCRKQDVVGARQVPVDGRHRDVFGWRGSVGVSEQIFSARRAGWTANNAGGCAHKRIFPPTTSAGGPQEFPAFPQANPGVRWCNFAGDSRCLASSTPAAAEAASAAGWQPRFPRLRHGDELLPPLSTFPAYRSTPVLVLLRRKSN